ncbi:MAG: ABC transporter permease, partial [Candidatus Hydrogenedens sp.]|nr:ABC transporter permease [Candidatus Hydrogenedens sp.]
MKSIWNIAKREFISFFVTPSGYVILGLIATLTGVAFILSFLTYVQISQSPFQYGYTTVPDFEETFLSPYFVFCGIMIMFLSPIISMRLLSEEYHRGTMELLLTYPLRDRDIILGKFSSALAMLALAVILIALNVFLLLPFTEVEWSVLLFGLCSVFLMGMAVLSIGLFISSLIKYPITAGLVSFGIYLLMFIIGNVAEKLPATAPLPNTFPAVMKNAVEKIYGLFHSLLLELPLDNHAKNMAL